MAAGSRHTLMPKSGWWQHAMPCPQLQPGLKLVNWSAWHPIASWCALVKWRLQRHPAALMLQLAA
eukprot:358424-Chlamydomonas_euryale.AAC.1